VSVSPDQRVISLLRQPTLTVTMELNWDAFLSTEGFDIPNDQWSDLTTLPAAPSTSEMPKSTTTDTSESASEDVNEFDPFLTDLSVDPYFVDDALFIADDYFPSGLDMSPPFADIMDSDEVTNAMAKFSSMSDGTTRLPTQLNPTANLDQSPQIQSSLRQAVYRANTLRNSESAYTNDNNNIDFDDIPFAEGSEGLPRPLEPVPETARGPAIMTTKRKKSKDVPDIVSACWTSPLCPNQDQNGVPPSPSNCGAGCAPFLFANDDALLDISSIPNEAQNFTSVDGMVDIQSRSRKRSDSNTSINEPSGRSISNTTASLADNSQRTKKENSQDLPVDDAEEAGNHQKPNSRRRVPHHQVERKYRDSLNTQLETLKRVVPSLQQQRVCDGADIEDLSAPSKPSKAVILSSATAYIKQVERDKKSLLDQNRLLRARIKALQALVKCDDCSLMQYVMDLKID
jgi:hypothetical protein